MVTKPIRSFSSAFGVGTAAILCVNMNKARAIEMIDCLTNMIVSLVEVIWIEFERLKVDLARAGAEAEKIQFLSDRCAVEMNCFLIVFAMFL